MAGVLVWADIPVTDMERAMRFYGHVLQTQLRMVGTMCHFIDSEGNRIGIQQPSVVKPSR